MKKTYEELRKKEKIYSAALIALITVVVIAAFFLSYLIISQL
jgi:flagellar biosynthesis/type III secretory pathway M-ring protein FliF/YscJ